MQQIKKCAEKSEFTSVRLKRRRMYIHSSIINLSSTLLYTRKIHGNGSGNGKIRNFSNDTSGGRKIENSPYIYKSYTRINKRPCVEQPRGKLDMSQTSIRQDGTSRDLKNEREKKKKTARNDGKRSIVIFRRRRSDRRASHYIADRSNGSSRASVYSYIMHACGALAARVTVLHNQFKYGDKSITAKGTTVLEKTRRNRRRKKSRSRQRWSSFGRITGSERGTVGRGVLNGEKTDSERGVRKSFWTRTAGIDENETKNRRVRRRRQTNVLFFEHGR